MSESVSHPTTVAHLARVKTMHHLQSVCVCVCGLHDVRKRQLLMCFVKKEMKSCREFFWPTLKTGGAGSAQQFHSWANEINTSDKETSSDGVVFLWCWAECNALFVTLKSQDHRLVKCPEECISVLNHICLQSPQIRTKGRLNIASVKIPQTGQEMDSNRG